MYEYFILPLCPKYQYLIMANKELRLKELLRERGITQTDLANRLPWYQGRNAAISFSQAIKRNKFDIDKLGDIVDALNEGIDESEHYTIADLFVAPSAGLRCPHCGKSLRIKIY